MLRDLRIAQALDEAEPPEGPDGFVGAQEEEDEEAEEDEGPVPGPGHAPGRGEDREGADQEDEEPRPLVVDRKSTRLNSSHT